MRTCILNQKKIHIPSFYPLLPKNVTLTVLVLKHCDLMCKKVIKRTKTVASSFGSRPSSHLLRSVITVNLYNV